MPWTKADMDISSLPELVEKLKELKAAVESQRDLEIKKLATVAEVARQRIKDAERRKENG